MKTIKELKDGKEKNIWRICRIYLIETKCDGNNEQFLQQKKKERKKEKNSSTSCNRLEIGAAISFIKGADLEGAPRAKGINQWHSLATPPVCNPASSVRSA